MILTNARILTLDRDSSVFDSSSVKIRKDGSDRRECLRGRRPVVQEPLSRRLRPVAGGRKTAVDCIFDSLGAGSPFATICQSLSSMKVRALARRVDLWRPESLVRPVSA